MCTERGRRDMSVHLHTSERIHAGMQEGRQAQGEGRGGLHACMQAPGDGPSSLIHWPPNQVMCSPLIGGNTKMHNRRPQSRMTRDEGYSDGTHRVPSPIDRKYFIGLTALPWPSLDEKRLTGTNPKGVWMHTHVCTKPHKSTITITMVLKYQEKT